MVAITRLLDRGTQCMSLSAATEHSKSRQGLPGPGSTRMSSASRSAIVDSDVVSCTSSVVGRAIEPTCSAVVHNAQGPDSRRFHQRAALCACACARWLARVLAASSVRAARRSARSELFQPYVTLMSHILVQAATRPSASPVLMDTRTVR